MSYHIAFCLRNSQNYFVMNVPSHTVSNNVKTRIIIRPGIIYTLSLGSLVWCCLPQSRKCVIAPSNSISQTSPVNLIPLTFKFQ